MKKILLCGFLIILVLASWITALTIKATFDISKGTNPYPAAIAIRILDQQDKISFYGAWLTDLTLTQSIISELRQDKYIQDLSWKDYRILKKAITQYLENHVQGIIEAEDQIIYNGISEIASLRETEKPSMNYYKATARINKREELINMLLNDIIKTDLP